MIQASVICPELDGVVKPSGNAVLPYQRSVMRVTDDTDGGASSIFSIFIWKLCVLRRFCASGLVCCFENGPSS